MSKGGWLAGAAVLALAAALPAAAQVKIGVISSMSGPEGTLGREMTDGINTAVREEGGKLGGVPVQIIVGDDQTKPDIGRQLADKMIESDHVAFITGPIFSNVLLAIARPVTTQNVFLISSNAGPSELAGKQCSPNFFSASFQNDSFEEAAGELMNQQGKRTAWFLGPNYAAAFDKYAGLKRTFKGEVKPLYTQFGQMDYAPQIAQLREARPDAVFGFYPGGMGINFVKQLAASGLNTEVPLYAEYSLFDETVLPAVGEAALGGYATTTWDESMDNPASKRFVADFTAYWGRRPSPYAAHAYDTARLIGSALAATGGKTTDTDALRAALMAAKFDSVRGHFAFNTNHFPIQDLWATRVEKGADGKPNSKLIGKIFTDHKDVYAAQCPMQ